MNGQWIRRPELDDLVVRVENFWPVSARDSNDAYRRDILRLVQDRLKTLADLTIMTNYFFEEPTIDWALIDTNKQLKQLSRF